MRYLAAALLVIMLLLPAAASITTATNIKEPELHITGSVTKKVFGNVLDNEGSLRFNVRNITIDPYYIRFSNPFINATVRSSITSYWQLDGYYLTDSYSIPYLLVHAKNISTLATATYMQAIYNKVDISVASSMYLLVGGKIVYSSWNAGRIAINFHFLDIGAEKHIVQFLLGTSSESITTLDLDGDGKSDDLRYSIATGALYDTRVVQKKIGEFEDFLSTEFSKMVAFEYGFSDYISPSQDTYEIKVAIRYALVSNTEIRINDKLLNSSLITNIKASTITCSIDYDFLIATIDFDAIVVPEKSYNADDLAIKYDYLFSLDTYDGEVSYSNVMANFTLGDFSDSSNANLSYFYVNGADYTDTLAAQGYYSFSVSADTQYYITAKFIVGEDVFDALIGLDQPPAFWSSPVDWFAWNFWNIIYVIGSALVAIGIGSSIQKHAKQQKRRIKARVRSK